MDDVKRILVIEDDPSIAGLLQAFLEDEGYTVKTFGSARPALDILKKEPFHLITLDLGLPSMDGNQFLRELQKINRSVPVIVISANVNRLQKTELVKAVLAKPFDLNELSMLVSSIQDCPG